MITNDKIISLGKVTEDRYSMQNINLFIVSSDNIKNPNSKIILMGHAELMPPNGGTIIFKKLKIDIDRKEFYLLNGEKFSFINEDSIFKKIGLLLEHNNEIISK